MTKLHEFIERFGTAALFRLLLYPLTVLITTPVRLIQSFIECSVFLKRPWGDYSHFNPHMGINSLFYWTEAINLKRYGRNGVSPCIGLGHFPLSGLFHLTLPSLYLFWRCGAVTVLVSMFLWWSSHLIWLNSCSTMWVGVIMTSALISTSFYLNTFALQNYNAVGWLFFPFGLFALLHGFWLTASIIWLLISFGSFTLVFMVGVLCFASSVSTGEIEPLLTVFPAVLKISFHIIPMLIHGNSKEKMNNIAKVIGFNKKQAKYTRSYMSGISVYHIYHLALYLQFGILSYILGSIDVLFTTSVALFVLNSKIVRFADEQSLQMLIVTVSIPVVLQSQSFLLLVSFWLLASPAPVLAGFPNFRKSLDVVPKMRPFDVRVFINHMETFLAPVEKAQKVFMAFDNPNGVYEKIFDGYRVLLELPLFVASRKGVHFMPDWWFVSELNHEGAPEYWGRKIESVVRNSKQLDSDFVVVYQEFATDLDPKWEETGFKIKSEFSWSVFEKGFGECIPIGLSKPAPKWWLLQCPQECRL